jgi:cysteine desulfurase
MQLYLDYSATTPCCPEAIALMNEVWQTTWGNPSSLHHWGERAATCIEIARAQVAALIQAPPETIHFTGGGTEADNLAILGITNGYSTPQHLIYSQVEHAAIAAPMKHLAAQGWQVTALPVDADGKVAPDTLAQNLRPNTVLVSIIYGQSEIGTLQPIPALAAIAHRHDVLFHTDAVQAAGRIPIDVDDLGVDLLSLSSHKLYGPQGVGALYLRPETPFHSPVGGGGQEGGVRPGTQAVATIAGFGIAAELAAQELPQEASRLMELRDRLFDLLADIPDLTPTGHRCDRLPHHVSFCFTPQQGQPPSGRNIVRQMNLAGIGMSSGSACNSGKVSVSPVLTALGYRDAVAQSGIRLTLGKETCLEDIEWAAFVLQQIIERNQT